MTKLNKQQVCDRLEISTRQLDYLIGRNEFPRGVSQGKAHKWLEEVVERFDRERFSDQLAWFHRK